MWNCKCGRRKFVLMFVVVTVFSYGPRTATIRRPTDASHCALPQSRHLARRWQVFRDFNALGDDNVERFGGDKNVIDKSVGEDELNVIEQCFGVKPFLMSKTSVKRNKLDSGKNRASEIVIQKHRMFILYRPCIENFTDWTFHGIDLVFSSLTQLQLGLEEDLVLRSWIRILQADLIIKSLFSEATHTLSYAVWNLNFTKCCKNKG
jgi:hypothetical protein